MNEQPKEDLQPDLASPILPPMPHPRVKTRFGVRDTTYFQPPNKEGTAVESNYVRWLESDEQPYVRHFKVKPFWTPLDSGWIEGEPSLMILKNDSGKPLGYNANEKELAEADELTVEVGFEVVVGEDPTRTMFSPERIQIATQVLFILLPGESLRVSPANYQALRLRTRQRDGRCILHLYPQ